MTTINIENPTSTPATTAKGIEMTEKALARIRAALAKENISPAEGGLRLGVQGGGCSGLSYVIRFEPAAASAIASFSSATCASSSIPSRSSICTAWCSTTKRR